MTVKFENPPINEVAIGMYFDPPINEIKTEHIGLFWNKIRKNFQVTQQQHPIPTFNYSTAIENPSEVYPMLRYWFISKDLAYLIQIQKEVFFLNWRAGQVEYSGYSGNVLYNFIKYFEVYRKFLQKEFQVESLTIHNCELTYINVIPRCDYWQHPKDISRIVPKIIVPKFEYVIRMTFR